MARMISVWTLALAVAFLLSNETRAQTLPVIEIEINNSSDPNDDFVTWAPTSCRARAASGVATDNTLSVSIRNALTNLNGRVQFTAAVTPWPANTTASNATLNLNLPGNGNWVDFVIAGEFGHSSIRRDDTVIVARRRTALR